MVIVFKSHLDLTWDKVVELTFFEVGRPPSHRVWDAYQPQTTDAYILDFTDCTRIADVYVKWLTWLQDWEMNQNNNVPWRMVGFEPSKRALEKHVQHSHEKALANAMPYVCLESISLFSHANVFNHDGKPVPIELYIVKIPRDGSDPEVICITVNHAGQTFKPKDFRSNNQENARLHLLHQPVTQECARGIPVVCVRGKFSQLARGNRSLMLVEGAKQQNFFQEFGLFAMTLETLTKFKDICDGTFSNPMHEGGYEEEEISCCTILKSYQFVKHLPQFNKLHAEWSYKFTVLAQ
ncbi:hypothetical protein TNCV_3264791 [Trichonephila clavipes]|nr:hypothetical protein TNCV_3264791 [Trichonephila clavipes]